MADTHSSTAHDALKRYGCSTGVLAVGALVLCRWLLSPHINYLHAVERLEPVVAQVAEEQGRIRGTRSEKLDELQCLEGELAALGGRFFTDDRIRAFLRRLLALVEETGCTVISAEFTGDDGSPAPADPNEPVIVAVCPVGLTVLGSHDQITTLIERLQSHRPNVWIDTCRISSLDERSARLECSLTLTMHVIRDRKMPEDT